MWLYAFKTLTCGCMPSHVEALSTSAPIVVFRYTRDEDDLESLERDVSEESGWKLVHGDVFRPPKHLEVLSALIGTGKRMEASALTSRNSLRLDLPNHLRRAPAGLTDDSTQRHQLARSF